MPVGPAPARLIPGGMPTDATVAHFLVSKHADQLPQYRQAQVYSRQGIDPNRSTLVGWVGKAAYELRPIFDALFTDLKRSTKLFVPSRQIAAQSPAG
jgi:transposase